MFGAALALAATSALLAQAAAAIPAPKNVKWVSKRVVIGHDGAGLAVRMPTINLGTCCGSESTMAVPAWLASGGFGIDTAFDYGGIQKYGEEKWVPGGTQSETGAAMTGQGVPRSGLFITTKVPTGLSPPVAFDKGYPWGDCVGEGSELTEAVYRQARENLRQLNTPYVDLTLLHAPCRDRSRNIFAWRGLERALAHNLTRAIGVSNYLKADLEDLLSKAKVVPAVDQCQLGLDERNDEDIAFAQSKGIVYEGYGVMKGCPIAEDAIGHEAAAAIAARHGVSIAQVCTRWALQRGVVLAIGLGMHQRRFMKHAADTLGAYAFRLDADEMETLNRLPTSRRCGPLHHAIDGCVKSTRF